MAQKTQRFGFQIRFSFLSITWAFLVRFSIPAPVLNSELRCGSNGILQWIMGCVWTELYRVKVNRAIFSSYTVFPLLDHDQVDEDVTRWEKHMSTVTSASVSDMIHIWVTIIQIFKNSNLVSGSRHLTPSLDTAWDTGIVTGHFCLVLQYGTMEMWQIQIFGY